MYRRSSGARALGPESFEGKSLFENIAGTQDFKIARVFTVNRYDTGVVRQLGVPIWPRSAREHFFNRFIYLVALARLIFATGLPGPS